MFAKRRTLLGVERSDRQCRVDAAIDLVFACELEFVGPAGIVLNGGMLTQIPDVPYRLVYN